MASLLSPHEWWSGMSGDRHQLWPSAVAKQRPSGVRTCGVRIASAPRDLSSTSDNAAADWLILRVRAAVEAQVGCTAPACLAHPNAINHVGCRRTARRSVRRLELADSLTSRARTPSLTPPSSFQVRVDPAAGAAG